MAETYDVVGDVHGCCDELEALLERLGYAVEWVTERGERDVRVSHPQGRKLVFVGDLVDRGPRTPDVLRVAIASQDAGGLSVVGNHDDKLARWLAGRHVTINNGLQNSIEQFEVESEDFRRRVRKFIEALPVYLQLDGGRLVVAHAGLKAEMIGEPESKVRHFALYGDTTGEKDELGYPVRRDWATSYSGEATMVYGHVAAPELEWVNNTICIDTGCVFGGELTALRWPERELVSEPAQREWYSAKRPLGERTRRPKGAS
jgi:protein phosphatase